MATTGTLQRLSAAALAELILAEQNPSNPAVAIIDVRDDDHIGGHIKGSQNIPSGRLDAMLPTLVRQLQDKQTVVFHCALSQQRGPGAALRYIRERERMFPSSGQAASSNTDEQKDGEKKETQVVQRVYVLDRGFVGWQEVHGEDERLTTGYRKDLWQDGYWG